jgi:hypothetical protein
MHNFFKNMKGKERNPKKQSKNKEENKIEIKISKKT